MNISHTENDEYDEHVISKRSGHLPLIRLVSISLQQTNSLEIVSILRNWNKISVVELSLFSGSILHRSSQGPDNSIATPYR